LLEKKVDAVIGGQSESLSLKTIKISLAIGWLLGTTDYLFVKVFEEG